MPLSREDVAGIADYARIALSDTELDEMTAYMNDAIALLDPILAYDLDGVEPTFHPTGDLVNVVREDTVVAGLSLEEALANAASIRGRSFRVPAILADGSSA
jgi:aspartyl-tRNA(Asn)/glutamyl-tRNA(Gln) amidotransferase subunit C